MLRAHSDWLELYPLNPLTVSRYREALFTSGAKDDPLDGQLIEELIYHHRDRFRPYEAPKPELRKLELLCQQRPKAVDATTACENELRSALKVFYPLALELHEELGCALTLHFLKRWPTLQQLKDRFGSGRHRGWGPDRTDGFNPAALGQAAFASSSFGQDLRQSHQGALYPPPCSPHLREPAWRRRSTSPSDLRRLWLPVPS